MYILIFKYYGTGVGRQSTAESHIIVPVSQFCNRQIKYFFGSNINVYILPDTVSDTGIQNLAHPYKIIIVLQIC